MAGKIVTLDDLKELCSFEKCKETTYSAVINQTVLLFPNLKAHRFICPACVCHNPDMTVKNALKGYAFFTITNQHFAKCKYYEKWCGNDSEQEPGEDYGQITSFGQIGLLSVADADVVDEEEKKPASLPAALPSGKRQSDFEHPPRGKKNFRKPAKPSDSNTESEDSSNDKLSVKSSLFAPKGASAHVPKQGNLKRGDDAVDQSDEEAEAMKKDERFCMEWKKFCQPFEKKGSGLFKNKVSLRKYLDNRNVILRKTLKTRGDFFELVLNNPPRVSAFLDGNFEGLLDEITFHRHFGRYQSRR